MDISKEIQLGIEAIKEKKLENAKQIFKKLSEVQPLNYEINHFLGISYQLLNNIDEAILSYKKTVEINPNFAEAHKNLGNMFYRLGKITDAEPCYKKALEINPQVSEATTVLNVIYEQKKNLSVIKSSKASKDHTEIKRNFFSDPYTVIRPVESNLIESLYKMDLVELNKTKDIRYGNGKCSPDLKLLEKDSKILQNLKIDLLKIMEKSVKAKIHIVESFFNILSSGSGTSPHRHIDPFDRYYKTIDQKYSLVYYISIGDQTGTEPGILKLYAPEKNILPSKGLIAIFPADREHSSTYNGKEDRVMIGVNFYRL